MTSAVFSFTYADSSTGNQGSAAHPPAAHGHAHVDAKAARRLARTALSGLAPDEVIEESVVLRLGRDVGDTGG